MEQSEGMWIYTIWRGIGTIRLIETLVAIGEDCDSRAPGDMRHIR